MQVRTNRQMASQYSYLPWICLAGGAPGGDGRMIDIEIGRLRAEECYWVKLQSRIKVARGPRHILSAGPLRCGIATSTGARETVGAKR